MKAKYLLPGQKGANCRTYFNVFIIVGTLITIQNLLIILLKPKKLHFLTSMLEAEGRRVYYSAPGVILLLLQVWIWFTTWVNFLISMQKCEAAN
ncbi:unnamed protein product [Orchesella dallaii]|uniref:Uncharacterized protein n=1 Tax=Orchesella dallaii TaxID=48710 RepID=A0ABP1PKY3_9HEXA